jgi:ATP-dependent DNA helicase RecG
MIANVKYNYHYWCKPGWCKKGFNTVLSVEEAQLKLQDLKQAFQYEKRHRYVDAQGRQKTFSAFVTETLNLLAAFFLEDVDTLAMLRRQFENYPFMDVGSRMSALQGVEDFFERKQRQQHASKNKSTVSVPLSQGQQAGYTGYTLQTEVQYVRGVGPKLAKLLANVGIYTLKNLLYYFPKRYIDYENRQKIMDLDAGQDVTVVGTIHSVNAYHTRNGQQAIVSVLIEDETGLLAANWFLGKASRAVLENHKSRYPKGAQVMASGRTKWDTYKKIPAIDRPQIEFLSYQETQDTESSPSSSSLNAGRIVPVYPLTEGLNLKFLRKAIHHALTTLGESIEDTLPEDILKRPGWIPLAEALYQMHFPDTMERASQARERLVFDELFYLQMRLAMARQHYKQSITGLVLSAQPGGLVEQFRALLPFALTAAQQRVIQEIMTDMGTPEPMYRLLQGDVGSGKTIVAMITLLVAVENGYQGALMAPTEILAEQHYRKCIEWLTALGLRIGLFVGKNRTKIRRQLQQDLLNGQIHIAVGTHALIQENVAFANLGVIVVDEQHRFGVRQRTMLKEKGQHPEMLTMTATPIPRTLAMTLHGDLDVSLLDELPSGRKKIKTSLVKPSQLGSAYQLIQHEVLCGRQAYIVFPLIEESETLSAKAATSEAERLQAEVFQSQRIGLLHGKLRPEEKEAVMGQFSSGNLDILVSTTVVEVGVDVPNATVMIIENADRFGLSQLHQLRGRVGRGQHQSYCILVSDSRSPETVQRLGILTESEDGFYISERDLDIRGPGEYLGTRQSGLPDLVLADLIEDKSILDKARQAAFELVETPEFRVKHARLVEAVFEKTEQSAAVLGSG